MTLFDPIGFADTQPDLFAPALLPGLRLAQDFVAADEACALIDRIDESGLSPFRFQQWTGKRLTRSYGWSYDFERGRLDPADPIPDWLQPLKTRAAAFAGLEADALVQALVIRYDVGAGIGWHKDRPVFEDVIGISLGAPATMRFRRRVGERFERATALLMPCSIYHLGGTARSAWEHSITEMEACRWSITFRSRR